MNMKTSVDSLAYRRLCITVDIWERNKIAKKYQSLYVCARNKGQKIKSVWVSPSVDAMNYISRELGETLIFATSFEVEFIWAGELRDLSFSKKNQWNSLRGKRAIEIKDGDRLTRWSALDMIAQNVSFNSVLQKHLTSSVHVQNSPDSIVVSLYQTKQYFCDNRRVKDVNKQVSPEEMFRGNRVVDVESISQKTVFRCMQGMTHWLSAQVDGGGKANYKYWPSRGVYADSNNAIRQWMATVCLNRAAKTFSSEKLERIVKRNLENNISNTFKFQHDVGYIWMNGSAKLGAAALAALAIFEFSERKNYLNEEYALYQLLDKLSNADGSFDTFLIPRERNDNQNFYSGEALLFLAARYSVSRNPSELVRILSAFDYYKKWHRSNRNPAFIPWHTQAYYLIWKVTKDDRLKDFIFEMNDWLLSVQQWNGAEFPDMQGRFYDPKRSHFGPPHASSTGVYLEGLADAFSLAKEIGDSVRTEKYRIAIVRGMRSIMQLQFKDDIDCFYIKHVNRVLGGVRTTVYDNTIRIDNVQHALMAFFKIYARFSAEDYSLLNVSKDIPTQQVNLKSSSDKKVKPADTNDILCFRLNDFKVDIHAMRCDFEENIKGVPATSYHHAGTPYEGWAITSRDGSIADGVKRISGEKRVLNGVKVEDSTIPTELCSVFLKDILAKLEALGLECFRVRYMKMGSENFQMKFHRDAKLESWRLHIPLYTNEHCFFEWKTKERGVIKKHFPADGSAYLVRVDELHRGTNCSTDNIERVHFILSLRKSPGAHLIDDALVEKIDGSLAEKAINGSTLPQVPPKDRWTSSDMTKIGLITKGLNCDAWGTEQIVMTKRAQSNGVYFARNESDQDVKYITRNQCKAVICDNDKFQFLKSKINQPIYVVEDMFDAARKFADHARARFKGKVIAVTGSVGKTTIKDGLVSLLSGISQVHAAKGNANADWGLLETISNTPLNADYAIYELGMLGRKSIGLKSRRVKPHIAVITNVFDAHRSFHLSDQSIAETKAEILEGLLDDGTAILPADSPWFDFIYSKAKGFSNLKLLTFGETVCSDIRLVSYDCSTSGTRLVVSILGNESVLITPLLGRQAALNCTILVAVVHALGINVCTVKETVKTLSVPEHRGEIFRVTNSKGYFTVVDDSWNASPASVISAIDKIKYLEESGNKILILGDMLQLGNDEVKRHKELTKVILREGIDIVYSIGELANSLLDSLPKKLRGGSFRTTDNFIGAFRDKSIDFFPGDVVLVKGSNALKLWRVVNALCGHDKLHTASQ